MQVFENRVQKDEKYCGYTFETPRASAHGLGRGLLLQITFLQIIFLLLPSTVDRSRLPNGHTLHSEILC